jgi:hypothetical protein
VSYIVKLHSEVKLYNFRHYLSHDGVSDAEYCFAWHNTKLPRGSADADCGGIHTTRSNGLPRIALRVAIFTASSITD